MTSAVARIVLLGDHVAGTIVRAPGGALTFTYDDGYRTERGATPLSVSMPLQVRTHGDAVITPWLWGLLPDNDRVLQAWARQFAVSASNPFALLASPIGEDCAGAVRIVAEERVDELTRGATSASVTWLSDQDVADRFRSLGSDSTAWLGARRTGRFSLAGAQPKTALLHRDGRWGEPRGALATTHILKPALAGFDDHDLNEHLCLTAMRRVGLRAVRSSVQRFGDQSAVVVQRYDRRVRADGSVHRLHQEDLAQALGRHPTRKYQSDGGPGPADVAGLLRRVMPADQAREDVEAFVGALLWNWIIAGTDAHAKNYSILLQGDEVALAPFYDVASALPYPDVPTRRLTLAMKLGSGYRVDPASAPWARLASDTGVREVRVREIADDLLIRAVGAFADAAAGDDVTALASDLPARMLVAIERRAVACRHLLDD